MRNDSRTQLKLADDDGCFACGKSNPIGLKLDFQQEGDEYVTYFTPGKEHQGYVGVVHGGLVSTVLDEVMVRYAYACGYEAVTAEICVRYKRSAATGKVLRVAGRIDAKRGKLINCSARAADDEGVVASATARLVRVTNDDKGTRTRREPGSCSPGRE